MSTSPTRDINCLKNLNPVPHAEPPLIPLVRGLQATIPETVTRSAASSVTGHMIFLRFATKWKRDFPAHFGPEWGSALNERSVGGTSIRPIE
jgi:hypothetical protein